MKGSKKNQLLRQLNEQRKAIKQNEPTLYIPNSWLGKVTETERQNARSKR